MSDQMANGPVQRHHKVPKPEYRVYFAMIFLAALPFTFVATVADLATGRDTQGSGPPRAWPRRGPSRPTIFSA